MSPRPREATRASPAVHRAPGAGRASLIGVSRGRPPHPPERPVAPPPAGAKTRVSAPPSKRSGFGGVAPAVWAMAIGYAVLYSVLGAIRYRYYLYSDFDLAIFAQ